MRYLGFAYLLSIVCLPCVCRADEVLNLQLPPSPAKSAPTPSTDAGSSSAGDFARFNRRRGATPSRRATSTRRAAASSVPRERVIGRLGVTTRSASIRNGRSSRRAVLANTRKGTYLALTHEAGDWYGVLMADRSTGWIRKSQVQVLNYEVVGTDTPQPNRYAGSYGSTDRPVMNGGAKTILDVAFTYLGVPYKWGGTSPGGLDCSGFVQRCFATMGINLPRTAREQINCGQPVTPEYLQPADRLYFASRSGRITHTGIYIGNGYFIHASSSRGGVAVSRLSEPMYRRMFAGARR